MAKPQSEKIFRAAVLAAALAAAACGKGPAPASISASGTIEAREIHVASKVGGQVVRLLFEEGTRVRAGETLALVDHVAVDIQLRRAEAGVALASAQLSLLRKGARTEDIQQAEAVLRQAEAALAVADADARRMRGLSEKGSVTPKQREDAEARQTVAREQANAARESVRKLRRLVRPEEIEAAEARLAEAGATADLLKNAVADSTIAAPFEGVVTARPVEAGELLTPGSVIAVLSELDRVHVMLYITEAELARVRLGDAAEVRVDGWPDRTFEGRVTYLSPQAEFTPKNIQTKEDRVKLVFGMKVEILNPDGLLKPGLPADATIRTGGGAAK
jgi:HlyD family secretion protein